MNNKFDELAKGMAQSVTRRQALRRFGVGLAGILFATLGFANTAHAGKSCASDADCTNGQVCLNGLCSKPCGQGQGCNCKKKGYGCCPGDLNCFVTCQNICGPAPG